MSTFHNQPELIAAMHAERTRRLRQLSRTRRPRPGYDDRRWD